MKFLTLMLSLVLFVNTSYANLNETLKPLAPLPAEVYVKCQILEIRASGETLIKINGVTYSVPTSSVCKLGRLSPESKKQIMQLAQSSNSIPTLPAEGAIKCSLLRVGNTLLVQLPPRTYSKTIGYNTHTIDVKPDQICVSGYLNPKYAKIVLQNLRTQHAEMRKPRAQQPLDIIEENLDDTTTAM